MFVYGMSYISYIAPIVAVNVDTIIPLIASAAGKYKKGHDQ